MWPWEHLAVGYLCYSLATHLRGSSPDGWAVLALAVGTQFPDLVDKPLGWVLGVVPSGQSVGHSILVATPVVAMGLLVGSVLGRRELAAAFGLGYLVHLPADALYPVLVGGSVRPGTVLWPLVPSPPAGGVAVLAKVAHLFEAYVSFLESPAGAVYLGAEVGFLVLSVGLWRHDGYPGLGFLRPTPSADTAT